MVEIVISPPPQQARMTPMALAPANSTLGTSVLKGSSGGQQFIVIPQSLLQQTGINNIFSGTIGNNANKKSVIKLSPKSPTMSPKITSSTPGIQIPQIGIKRPLTSSSPDLSDSNSIYDDEDSNCPVRKRANLDHLSPEEKMMRRKLKNRVAAQNARDKKRVKMDEMEDRINKLQEEKDQLEADNRRLSRLNEQLMSENNALRGSSPTRLSVDGFKDELPPSPESMPRSPLPTTFDSQSDQTIVVSRPSEPAELANALLPKGQGQDTAVDPKQTAVTTAVCLLWTLLAVATTPHLINQASSKHPLTSSQSAKWPPSGTSTTSLSQLPLQTTRTKKPILPLKKRTWSGLKQRLWSPAKT
ncbi:probable basic-leucine zipper transcription factor N [Tigriopus californicus]|uniref:probable basic-leucine zipper transcription factor N n=1 Tax=Tigriopus californicus TaxID=6832 RepID=UPI0027DA2359|nr:probable basic-leucine zipper transcription factor N [Tigriopus californicus]